MNTNSNNQAENLAKPVLTTVFLAPYLSYGLKVIFEGKGGRILEVTGIRKIKTNDIYFSTENETLCIDTFKPILKPLGDLTKDEKTCDEINEFLEPNGLEINNFLLLKNSLNAVAISWEEMQNVLNILYREHYDVFGLINKRLAISIHDVE